MAELGPMIAAVVVVALSAAVLLQAATAPSPSQPRRQECRSFPLLESPRIGERTQPRATCEADGRLLACTTRGASPL